MHIAIDNAKEGDDQTAVTTLHNGIIVSIKAVDGFSASTRRIARLMKRLALSFGGEAPKAGYYIINKRGRNKLVPLGKEITIDDRR
jgi:hypothetical protein